ncbi:triose-phosphate isomerase [Patescibacteria group bacterium]|nr:triose-phosphate isomerase [Patescibacteria group bacterium]
MKYVIGNWKMNLGIRESVALARSVVRALRGDDAPPNVVLCASFTSLSEVHKVLARSRIDLGAQNAGVSRSGSYTGEISPYMLEDVGVSYVIIGHSERRYIFGESDEVVRRRLEAVIESKLIPIICIGETKEAREGGTAEEFVKEQLAVLFDGLRVPKSKKMIVAYEPVWAIGTMNPAPVIDVISMQRLIRETVASMTARRPEDITVIYGGSVTGKNAYEYLREAEIGGLLIGGASLKISEFTKILESTSQVLDAQKS